MKLLMLAAGISCLCAADGVPDFSGQWKRQETGRASIKGPREIVLTIRHKEPVLHYRAQGVMGISSPFVEELEFTTNGSGAATPGKLGAAGIWEGGVLVVRYLKDSRQVATVRMSLSPDRKRLTREVSMDGRPTFIEIYDRR